MSERLVEEGWLAPARPGPGRVHVAIAVVAGVLALATWFALTMTWKASSGPDDLQTTVIELNERGRAAVGGSTEELPVEVRSSRGVDYLAVALQVDNRSAGAQRVSVQLPAGVDPERTTLRVVGSLDEIRIRRDEFGKPRADVTAGGPSDDLRVLFVAPAELFNLPADKRESTGDLADLTRPIDESARSEEDELRTLNWLRDASPWLLPLLLVASAGVPLLLWWRARQRFFSMRRPGPGKELDSAPPSSLDPVGAAVLVAGARGVDAAAAFAGHVLDLVERRQLLMRRTMDVDPGAGVLIGLGHADELDDAAVDALRAAALPDGITAAVTDSRAKLRRVPEAEQDAWHLHVAARERFEGMVDRVDPKRLLGFAALLVVIAIVAIVGGAATELYGRRALLWLAAAIALPSALTFGLWARDAASWRIVTRARRTERAQWIAWRSVVGTSSGPALDQRNLPVIAATGADLAGVRTFTGPDAVALDAVTTKTINGLKAMIADD